MFSRNTSILCRLATYCLILTLVLAPQASFAAQAAPNPAAPHAVAAPGDHLVTNLSLGPDTPNILRTNQDVTINFSYSTTQVGGVRIFIRPYSSGSPTPSYAASGSPLYPQSATGTGSGTFTITSGAVVVDQLHIEMLDANQTVLLFEAFVPAYYLFSDAGSVVSNFSYRLDTPNVLAFDQEVSLSFNYITRQQGGVLIFARPFTNGALTPNYAASGSPIYPTGAGAGNGSFTILSQQVVVDQIRIQMWDTSQTTLLFEAFLPVYYRFRPLTNLITSISILPDTPNIFKYNQDVTLNFNYTTSEPGGVRIFARPFSGANLSPNYAAGGSPLYPTGSGSGSNGFTLTAGPLTVDRIRIQMFNSNQSTLLFEAFLPVSLLWAGAGPPPGPDMQLNAIEVTQAIQDLNNSVDLVAGKKTYVRVHASSPVNVTNVFATLSGRRGFVNMAPVLTPGNPGGSITVRTNPDRGQINDSFWFELPSGWTTAGGLTLTARLDPNNAKNDLVQGNNTLTTIVNFKDTPPLRLNIEDVQYTSSGSTYLAANFHMDDLESWLRRAYPISTLQVTRHTFVYPTAGLPNVDTLHGWLALSKLLNIIFSGEDPRIVYYGMVDDGGGFMRGKALGIPGTVAAGPTGTGNWGWDYDGSYGDRYGGHEIGHTRGRYHAEFCGATGGAPYPYPGGRISPTLTGTSAIYGFDITTLTIYPPSWEDVMTYCSNEWVSDFTYEGIRSYLVGTGFALQSAEVTAAQFLAIVGRADLNVNTAALDNVYLVNQDNTLALPTPGGWDIVLVDGSNVTLADYPFAPNEQTDSQPGTRQGIISEIVPWAPGSVEVQIRYQGKVVAFRKTSANAPTVKLTSPAGGAQLPPGPFQVSWIGSDLDNDPLTYSVLMSSNGGLAWTTLADNLTDTSLQLNTDQISGGGILLRVVASDGFLSGQDTSGTIIVPKHAPSAEILLPTPNQVFYPTQQVTLQGSAYDLEDGTLGDAAFQWSSSIDGPLGSGTTLNTSELSTGSHVITLTVTDSDGMTTQVQRTLVVAQEGTPVAVNFDIAPFEFGAVAGFGSAPVQYPLSVHSSSPNEFAWTASKDAAWLSLDASSGQTPSELTVTIDPSQLVVGTHTATITFSSPTAVNAPFKVTVNLQVTGNSLFMPMIRK
jgi:hypothetical protein